MSLMRFPVTVVVERIPLVNRWASEQWRVAAVEPAGESMVAECIRTTAAIDLANAVEHSGADASSASRRWRVSGLCAELHESEAQGYYLNITAPAPKIFVMCRYTESGGNDDPKLRPHLVTVSYDEAARFMDGGEQVEAAPLPASLLDWMRPFVTMHYRPEPPRKVRRNELYERDGAVLPASRKRLT